MVCDQRSEFADSPRHLGDPRNDHYVRQRAECLRQSGTSATLLRDRGCRRWKPPGGGDVRAQKQAGNAMASHLGLIQGVRRRAGDSRPIDGPRGRVHKPRDWAMNRSQTRIGQFGQLGTSTCSARSVTSPWRVLTRDALSLQKNGSATFVALPDPRRLARLVHKIDGLPSAPSPAILTRENVYWHWPVNNARRRSRILLNAQPQCRHFGLPRSARLQIERARLAPAALLSGHELCCVRAIRGRRPTLTEANRRGRYGQSRRSACGFRTSIRGSFLIERASACRPARISSPSSNQNESEPHPAS